MNTKKLYYSPSDGNIVFSVNNTIVRYTDIERLPHWWEGKEDEALADWGIQNKDNIDRFAILVFTLYRYWDANKVEVYFTHNGEYKIVYLWYIKGFVWKHEAEKYLSSLLSRDEELEYNGNHTPWIRGVRQRFVFYSTTTDKQLT